IDTLLGTEEFDLSAAREALQRLSARGIPESDPRHQSVGVRVRNIERLQGIRDRTLEDLERIALKLEEMSSRLKLLRFAGRPDAAHEERNPVGAEVLHGTRPGTALVEIRAHHDAAVTEGVDVLVAVHRIPDREAGVGIVG